MHSSLAIQFCEKFATIAAEVLKQLAGKDFSSETVEVATGQEPAYSVVLRTKSDSRRELVLRYGSDVFRLLVEALLGGPVGDEPTTESAEIVLEAWRQVVGRANTALREELGGDELDVFPVDSEASHSLIVGFRLRAETNYEVIAEFSSDFFPISSGATGENVPASTQNAMEGLGHCDHRNLDLLLGIPLSVTLRFGERRMPLRNILELSSGAVLELDRHADEPVDLCLDERVIARGQVVVVDGCYGLRITQICRPVDYGMGTGARS